MRKIICVDFDGVLHDYRSGWQGADVVADEAVPGAMLWLHAMVNSFEVVIYSSRSSSAAGREAMSNALHKWAYDELGETHGSYLVANLRFSREKPPAFLTIDDRCMCFNGKFPTPYEIDSFVPWNRRGFPGEP